MSTKSKNRFAAMTIKQLQEAQGQMEWALMNRIGENEKEIIKVKKDIKLIQDAQLTSAKERSKLRADIKKIKEKKKPEKTVAKPNPKPRPRPKPKRTLLDIIWGR